MKSTALLVREEGFYFKSLAVIVAGFFCRDHVRNQMDGLLAVVSPPSYGENRPVVATSERCVGNIEEITVFHILDHVIKAKL